MNVLGQYYGGTIEPEALVLHFKPCLKDIIVYDCEIYIASETKDISINKI